jgi:nucleoside-diphosphate-sugar epimerase
VRGTKAGSVSVYQHRRVLVVGGLGFIGRHVTDRLQAGGAAVTVVTRSVADHREAALMVSGQGANVVEGDLRDPAAMAAAVRGQDVVFNLAGQSGAARSMDDPYTDLDVNVRGNLVLLDALRVENPGAKLVFASSRLAYGSGGHDPIDEARPSDPLCVHAVHKLAVEQYLRLYRKIYGLRATTARLTNPYGPGQPQGRTAYGVVNRLIHMALADQPLPIFGDGRQRRDYIYIDDAVDALLALGASADSDGRVYNVGSGIGMPLVEMARAIVEMTGSGRLAFVEWPKLAEQIETGDFVADIGRIRRDLGWMPRVSVAEGLRRTVSHYRAQVS